MQAARNIPAPTADRAEIADYILRALEAEQERLARDFATPGQVSSCLVDDVLPEALVQEIYEAFPPSGRMTFKNSIKERKYVAAQMDEHPAILEEAVYAFQDPRVVALVAEITGLQAVEPDVDLYAGGVSAMPKGAYLKPHLDNSHDKDQKRYRVLNLLFYVTPGWRERYGGNLELWDQGPKGTPRTIESRSNRLVLMKTDRTSWHSVSEVREDGVRCCVSNYYFSTVSPDAEDYFHATSFRGRPEEKVADLLMATDNALRTTLLKTLGAKAYNNPHVYRRPPQDD